MIPIREKFNPLELVSAESDPWAVYRGQIVEIRQNGASSGGVYHGLLKGGNILLQPFIEDRALKPALQERYKIPCTLNWNEGPLLVSPAPVLNVIPRTKEFWDSKIAEYQIPCENLREPEYYI